MKLQGSKKTIVSLDLQLYSKCIKLRSRHEIHEEFALHLGELYTIFAMLKVIEKYIEASGLEKILDS